MKVIIFGGAGFIGSHLARKLVSLDFDVTIFCRQSSNLNNIKDLINKVKIIYGDFASKSDVLDAVKGNDLVFHLISFSTPGKIFSDPTLDIVLNVSSSINLFESCLSANVKKIFFISSGGTIYGVPKHTPINEAHSTQPISPYGISKLTIEKYLHYINYHFGIDYSIVRLSNPFGINLVSQNDHGVILNWSKNILNNLPIEIWGNGLITRDYIHIHDTIEAISILVNNHPLHKIYNIGSSVGTSLLDLHRLFEIATDRTIPIKFIKSQKIDVPSNVLDVSRFRNEFNWHCNISLLDGIKLLLNHLRIIQ